MNLSPTPDEIRAGLEEIFENIVLESLLDNDPSDRKLRESDFVELCQTLIHYPEYREMGQEYMRRYADLANLSNNY